MMTGSTRRLGGFSVLWLVWLVACGPALRSDAKTPSTPAPDSGPLAEATTGEKSPAMGIDDNSLSAEDADVDVDLDDDLDSDIAAITESLGQGAHSELLQPEPARDIVREPIVYRVSPQGLTIEVDGLHFKPSVRSTRHRNGTYSLKIELRAESFDGRVYWIRGDNEGPLSIAGSIKTARGTKKARFSDRRRGGELRQLEESEPLVFRQTWPGADQPHLRRGETLTLEVGLWGTRAEEERERPVRRLFTVEFLAQKGEKPAISPPALDWGS